MKLTPNFEASEFDKGEPWPVAYAANRLALAELAQKARLDDLVILSREIDQHERQ